MAIPLAHLLRCVAHPLVDHPLIHPRTLQTAAIALALLSLAWTLFRLIFKRAADRLFTLLNPPWPSVDSIIAYIALAIFCTIFRCDSDGWSRTV